MDIEALASNIIVDCNGNGNYTTIQEAINNAISGQTIHVWDGIYNEDLIIGKTLTLIGNSTQNATINGSGTGDVIFISANWVNITGFTINNSGDDKWVTKDSGIEIDIDMNNISIYNNVITNNTYGILLGISTKNNVIRNNFISNNEVSGIYCERSDFNLITDNKCNENVGSGIYIDGSFSNSILNNTCNYNNWHGINIISQIGPIKNNICNFNKGSGIRLTRDWLGCTISDNICNQNDNNGIFLDGNNNNFTIINNECNLNINNGIEVKESGLGMINKNNCNSNIFNGVELYESINISINNNHFELNNNGFNIYGSNDNKIYWNNFTNNKNKGLQLFNSQRNEIKNNYIDNNKYGCYLEQNSFFNYFSNNTISNSSGTGIFILTNCNYNLFFHNQILSNSQQAVDNCSNNWSNQNQGNYWSDYTGLDNGANGRWKGDGIGDTNIPHPGLKYDNFPFIEPLGWRYPAIPQLFIEEYLDSDRNYTIYWNNRSRANGFILEEDTDITFTSPTIYTDGWILNYGQNGLYFKNKNENTYYYRIKSYNDITTTDWSDVVNVTVDYLPMIPKNLHVDPVPDGNALNIKWIPNLKDTMKYDVFYYKDQTWELIESVIHPDNSIIHTGLIDGKVYTYRICAIDSMRQSSGFSENITGIPKDTIPPSKPKGLVAVPISNSEIELTWDANSDPDLAGYLIFINKTGTYQSYTLNEILFGKRTSYIITGLNEDITYYFKIKAFDEVPNNSSFSDPAWGVIPDETHPKPPTEVTVSNATHYSLTVTWEPSPDKDVVGYIIYHSKSKTSDYQNRSSMINTTKFVDMDLDEDSVYYYKVRAFDDYGLASLESEVSFGRTLIGPKPPEINNTINDFEFSEDSTDDVSIHLNYLFKDVNNDKLEYRCEGYDHIEVTIDQETGGVILEPEDDWCGMETLTFYANDSRWEISYEINVTITNVNDPPGIVEIIAPKNNSIFYEKDILQFQGKCIDPDLPYGDKITFSWFSDRDGEIGKGINITGINLSVGQHIITLLVKDKSEVSSQKSITLIILEKNKNGEKEMNYTMVIFSIGVSILIIILTIIIFLYIRKRKNRPIKTSGENIELKVQSESQNISQQSINHQFKKQSVNQLPVKDINQQLQNNQSQDQIGHLTQKKTVKTKSLRVDDKNTVK
jgi:parallel beta-helix repeat protein